ncbi:hypothetical protein DPMN_052387 [Dreissena polymorpha]|uniref:Uncharacterized protein n=1 Tax=Dreissena polymorpha TaxID=45954 RepID=A0A9D4HPU3_DREPO|nr:hypothetical protein DPMN_052387 [Dreissena polymorpha]
MKCPSCNTTKPRTNKPKSGGREITSDSYKNELATDTSKITPSSPLPSTSGLQINRPDVSMKTDTNDDELDDTVPCCVCKQITPPDLSLNPHLKIVKWAQCDKCDGWVHLAFCTTVRVVRRQSEFVCPKCEE